MAAPKKPDPKVKPLDPSFHQGLADVGYRKVPSKFGTHRTYYRDTPIQQPANRAVVEPLLTRHGFKKMDTHPESWDNGRATVIFNPSSKTWKQHRLEVIDPDDSSGGDHEWKPTEYREGGTMPSDPIKPKKPVRKMGDTISLSSVRLDLLVTLAAMEKNFTPQRYLDKLRGEYDDLDEKNRREANNKMLRMENRVQEVRPHAKRSPLEMAATTRTRKEKK